LNNSCHCLENIKVPTTIIWAKDDQIFPVEIAKKLHAMIKKSRLFIVSGNHDWVLYDENKCIDCLDKAII